MPLGRPRTRQEGDLCDDCGTEPVRTKGYAESGEPRFDKRCGSCHRARYKAPWLKHRGDSCEMCGYTPFWKQALDVHHRDGDKKNNDTDNLMTICASCHRELHQFEHQHGSFDQAESLLKRFLKSGLGRKS